jgi:hypothetical protein
MSLVYFVYVRPPSFLLSPPAEASALRL